MTRTPMDINAILDLLSVNLQRKFSQSPSLLITYQVENN